MKSIPTETSQIASIADPATNVNPGSKTEVQEARANNPLDNPLPLRVVVALALIALIALFAVYVWPTSSSPP